MTGSNDLDNIWVHNKSCGSSTVKQIVNLKSRGLKVLMGLNFRKKSWIKSIFPETEYETEN